ncbi:MAG: hypothetical protein K0S65_1047 [Labilithrix sp.]|nr:hypothetical protein [Labilithrix sp.]
MERKLGAVALAVGRTVARSASVLPWLVRRASGLERPSPEAVAGGLFGGIGALAPAAIGPIGGACVDAAGSLAVLAIATWTVRVECTGDGFEQALADAIADLERRGLCHGRTAWVWRAAAGLGSFAPDPRLATEATVAGVRAALGRTLEKAVDQRLTGTASVCLGFLGAGLSLAGAWRAMGDAAWLVESTREHAAREALARAPLPQVRQVVSTMIPAGSRARTAVAAAASR